jgi:hypothetical protein
MHVNRSSTKLVYLCTKLVYLCTKLVYLIHSIACRGRLLLLTCFAC